MLPSLKGFFAGFVALYRNQEERKRNATAEAVALDGSGVR
jgi:hypothetical protein